MVAEPEILALDFDGVICNGLPEYFQTSWQVFNQVWDPADNVMLSAWESRFAQLRPVIETGWEMPVLLRAMQLGHTDSEILHQWPDIVLNILEHDHLDAKALAIQVDSARDQWIQTDLSDWLSYHHLYQGVAEKLSVLVASSIQLYIITTKEGRFVSQLLQKYGIQLEQQALIGKEAKTPKPHTLKTLIQSGQSLWFVEDRLKTLRAVQKDVELSSIKLFLADWGYNTATERHSASIDPHIQLLSLDTFLQDLTHWLAI